MAYKNLNLYGQGKITSTSTITIETASAWHFIDTMEADLGVGLSVDVGSQAAITGFADAGGGKVTITSNAHGLTGTTGVVSIVGTTNYNNVFMISNPQTNTFDITSAYTAEAGGGTWRHGTHASISQGQGGTYQYTWACSAISAAVNQTFEFAVFAGITPAIAAVRKFATGTDAGAVAGVSIIQATAGEYLSFAIRNLSGTDNLDIESGTWTIIKTS